MMITTKQAHGFVNSVDTLSEVLDEPGSEVLAMIDEIGDGSWIEPDGGLTMLAVVQLTKQFGGRDTVDSDGSGDDL